MTTDWDLTAVYDDRSDWVADAESVETAFERLADRCGQDTVEPDSLLSAFEQLAIDTERLLVYAKLSKTDPGDLQRAKRLYKRLSELRIAVRAAVRRSGVDRDRLPAGQRSVLNGSDTDDETAVRERTLRSVSTAFQVPKRTYRTLLSETAANQTDSNHYDLTTILRTGARASRAAAYHDQMSTLKQHDRLVGSLVESMVSNDAALTAVRDAESAREMRLSVPTTVHQRLCDGVGARLAPFRRFLSTKRRRLGVDSLEPWDLYVMDTTDHTTVSPGEARSAIESAVSVLGSDCSRLVERIGDEQWVSYDDGADFRSSTTQLYDPHPFVRLSFDGSLASVYSLAHEYGHAVHGYVASESCSVFDFKPASVTGEVVSHTFEVLVHNQLLDTLDPDAAAVASTTFLTRLSNSLYMNTMLAAFEQALFEAYAETGRLSTDRISELYGQFCEMYFPMVDHGDFRAEWLDAPHLFSPYTNHQYGICSCVALVLATGLLSGEYTGDEFVTLLRAGSSAAAIDILNSVDVNLTDDGYIDTAVDSYERYCEEYASLTTTGG
jgi:oligoendopeptidase F